MTHNSHVALAYKYVKTWQAAEDVVQDSWVKALRKWDDCTGNRDSWFNSIVVRTALNYHRGHRATVQIETLPVEAPNSHEDDLWYYRLSAVRDAIKTLPTAQRRAVELCGLDGLKRRDAAAILGVKEDAVRVNYHVAIKKLKKLLEEI